MAKYGALKLLGIDPKYLEIKILPGDNTILDNNFYERIFVILDGKSVKLIDYIDSRMDILSLSIAGIHIRDKAAILNAALYELFDEQKNQIEFYKLVHDEKDRNNLVNASKILSEVFKKKKKELAHKVYSQIIVDEDLLRKQNHLLDEVLKKSVALVEAIGKGEIEETPKVKDKLKKYNIQKRKIVAKINKEQIRRKIVHLQEKSGKIVVSKNLAFEYNTENFIKNLHLLPKEIEFQDNKKKVNDSDIIFELIKRRKLNAQKDTEMKKEKEADYKYKELNLIQVSNILDRAVTVDGKLSEEAIIFLGEQLQEFTKKVMTAVVNNDNKRLQELGTEFKIAVKLKQDNNNTSFGWNGLSKNFTDSVVNKLEKIFLKIWRIILGTEDTYKKLKIEKRTVHDSMDTLKSMFKTEINDPLKATLENAVAQDNKQRTDIDTVRLHQEQEKYLPKERPPLTHDLKRIHESTKEKARGLQDKEEFSTKLPKPRPHNPNSDK